MYRCIYCQNLTSEPSREHILQSALGARATRSDMVCASCNNAFSDRASGAIDDVLAEQFVAIRNALVIWSGRNQPPPIMRRAGLHEGCAFDLAPGLVPVFPRCYRVQHDASDGYERLTVIAPTLEEAKRQAEHLRRQYGERIRAVRTVSRSERVGEVSLALKIGGQEALRAIGKSLFNLAGAYFAESFVGRREFDAFRCLVRFGGDVIGSIGHDYFNPFPSAPKLGEFDHALSIVSDPASGTVRGYAMLFGHFRFSAVLASDIDVKPACVSLVQDPVERTKRQVVSEDMSLNFDLSILECPERPQREASHAVTQAMVDIFDAVAAAAPRRLAEATAADLRTRIDETVTEDDVDRLATLVATRIANALVGTPFEESLDPVELGF